MAGLPTSNGVVDKILPRLSSHVPLKPWKCSLGAANQLLFGGPRMCRRLLALCLLLVAFFATGALRLRRNEVADSTVPVVGKQLATLGSERSGRARAANVEVPNTSSSSTVSSTSQHDQMWSTPQQGEEVNKKEFQGELEGDLNGSLPDHDEHNANTLDAGSGKEGLGPLPQGESSVTNVLDKKLSEALSFDVQKAGDLWDKTVGCAAFREKHKDLISRYSNDTWVESHSFQRPFIPGVDSCNELKLRHVTVLVAHANWLPDWMDSTYTCSCGITCIFSRSPVIADNPHVALYEGAKPPWPNPHPASLTAVLNLESAAHEPKADIWINYAPTATVQCTFAGNIFHVDRNRFISDQKRSDVPMFFAASNPSKFRDPVVKSIIQVVYTHSVGRVQNNLEGVSEMDMYPHCKHVINRDFGSYLHCVQSHYKFTLAVENKVDYGYVTEKFFYALESGTVPVYIGAPDVAAFAPPDSFISASDKDRIALRKEIEEISNDTVRYMNFHAWRRCGVLGNYVRSRALSLDTVPCRICEAVSRKGGRSS